MRLSYDIVFVYCCLRLGLKLGFWLQYIFIHKMLILKQIIHVYVIPEPILDYQVVLIIKTACLFLLRKKMNFDILVQVECSRIDGSNPTLLHKFESFSRWKSWK